ncbi:hypothetical protein TNCV_1982631 [Trichonephila clavipes]|nr:hypothetical protein TNCV_1982631 [Trichonephila clavipes]
MWVYPPGSIRETWNSPRVSFPGLVNDSKMKSRQLPPTSTTVSKQTVYRHLGHIGLYARRPAMCSIYCNSLSTGVRLEWRTRIVDTATVGLCNVFRRVQV